MGVKYTFNPLYVNLRVIIARFKASIIPSRGRERRPVDSTGCGWPDNHQFQRLTICAYALNGSYHFPIDARPSIVSPVILAYKDLDRAKHAEHDPYLVHIVDIAWHNVQLT